MEETRMPQISIYIDNENYFKFLQKKKEERERIRKEANKTMIEEITKTVKS